MDQLSPQEPFAVVGHSMGALVAMELALGRPERVAAVALLDVPLQLPMLARLSTLPVLGDAVFSLPAFAPASRTAMHVYLSWLFGDPSRLSRDVVEAYTSASARPHYWKTTLKGLRGIKAWVGGERLASLKVPALVVWGQKDPLLPVSVGRSLADLIPGADFVPLAGCGHSPPEEAPAALSEAVLSHFERKAGFLPLPGPGAPALPGEAKP